MTMRYNRVLKKVTIPLAVLLCAILAAFCFIPMAFGAAGPAERIRRWQNGGNWAVTMLETSAMLIGSKSGTFDLTADNLQGTLTYSINTKTNSFELYYKTEDVSKHNQSASYILYKDGTAYSFATDQNGWYFKNSRFYGADFKRLLTNFALILAEKEVSLGELETDLNCLLATDLSDFFNFKAVPTAIRSLFRTVNSDTFKTAAGYEFERRNATLIYSLTPTDAKTLTAELNACLRPAYTDTMQMLMGIADLADGLAGVFGFDLYGLFMQSSVTAEIGAFSGRLKKLQFSSEKGSFCVENITYGNSEICIESPALEALIATHAS